MSMVDVSGQIKATRLLHHIFTEMEQQACALVLVEGHRRPLSGLEAPTGHTLRGGTRGRYFVTAHVNGNLFG